MHTRHDLNWFFVEPNLAIKTRLIAHHSGWFRSNLSECLKQLLPICITLRSDITEAITCDRTFICCQMAAALINIENTLRRGRSLAGLLRSVDDSLRLTATQLLVKQKLNTSSYEQKLLVTEEKGLGKITINRPKALNAKNCGMLLIIIALWPHHYGHISCNHACFL